MEDVPTAVEALEGREKSLEALKVYNANSRGKSKLSKTVWNTRHTRILSLIAQGVSVPDIAKRLGMSRTNVYAIIKRPDVKAKFEAANNKILEKVIDREIEHLDNARKVLREAAVDAANTIVSIAQRGKSDDRIKLEACQDILDRMNIKGKETIVNESRVYSPEELESAKKTLVEIEGITARVTTSQSRFVLHKQTQLLPNTTQQAQDDATTTNPDSTPRPETLPE